MLYSFARVSAVLKLRVDDYYHNGARRRLRLHEKGGKEHEMPVHHLLEQILDEYVVAAGLQSGQPLFQSFKSLGMAVTGRALNRYNAWAAIRKRARAAGFLTPVGCHTWQATGITIYLENDGRLEHAQQRYDFHRTLQYVSCGAPMNQLLNFGEIVAMNAYVSPDKVGARDLTRSLTFRGWNDRSCKLANALVGLGLEKGDRISVLAYNCLEWMEIYAAADQFQAGWLRGPVHRRELRS